MNKFFLATLLFFSLQINCNNAFPYSDIEYFPGERKTTLLDYSGVVDCLRTADTIKITHFIDMYKYTLDKDLIQINEHIKSNSVHAYEALCSGAGYFKEDYDQAVKQVSAGYNEDALGLGTKGYGITLAKYISKIIDYKLNLPFLNPDGLNYIVIGSLLNNKYFVADTSLNPILGAKVNNKERIHLSNIILSRLGFHVSKTNMKQKTPDKKAIFAFKLHMLKNSPFVQPASPLFDLDIKTCMLLDYCYGARDSKCFKNNP